MKPKPSDAGPKVLGAKATYLQVFDGVDLTYTAINQGLKEELILAGPDAPAIYDFTVNISSDLKAKENPAGGIDLTEPSGNLWAQFQPPYVYDASFPDTQDPTKGISGEAVTMRIVSNAAELVVRLAVDHAWLDDPARQWPVVLDPTVGWYSGQDTFITSYAPTTNYDYHPWLVINGSSTPYRSLYKPDVNLATYFTEPVEILSASVNLWANYDTTGQATQPVAVHEVSADWIASQATWNRRRTGLSWATPGGAFNPSAESVNADVTGPIGRRSFNVTRAVRGWVNDAKPNNGFLLKFVNDSAVTPTIGFNSLNSDSGGQPYLTVYWQGLTAVRSPYSYQSFDLGERREAMVNLASGNLGLKELDLSISGTGLDATLQRTYASRDSFNRSIGARWAMWPQAKERLYLWSNGDVDWYGGPEMLLQFARNTDGSFRSPHGYRATLVLAGGI